MKQPNFSEDNLHDRADQPSAAELRSMAMRQQQQIDTQHQMLAAKEQRLRFLKSQETRNAVSVAEAERLRRLRERVEAQESKLRRLRALRGQVDLQKTYNVTLGNDLDSIRALFSEKEKELTLAVAKVEALTRQLEDLRRDRRGGGNGANGISFNINSASLNANGSPAAKELEKLRLELAYRNQLSMQQNARLNMQREALQQRQIELHSVDKRIVELQSRINKKRILNVQNYKLNAENNAPNAGGQNHMKAVSSNTSHPLHARSSSTHLIPTHSRTLSRGNVVAVEPFNHIPVKTSSLGSTSSSSSSPMSTMSQDFEMKNHSDSPGFYDNENVLFDMYNNGNMMMVEGDSSTSSVTTMDKEQSPISSNSSGKGHSKVVNNGQGNNQENQQQIQSKHVYNFLQNIPLGNLVVPPRKPINSVAPTLATKPTANVGSSTMTTSNESGAKITSVTRKAALGADNSSAMVNEVDRTSNPTSPNNNSRPALPPKPSKPPGAAGTNGATGSGNGNGTDEYGNEINANLTVGMGNNENDSSSTASFDMPDLSVQGIINKQVTANDKLPIKAKPLTIRKHPFLEQPKLKNLSNSNSANSGNGGIGSGMSKLPNAALMQQQQQQISKRKESITASGDAGNVANDGTQYGGYGNEAYYDKKAATEAGEYNAGREHPIDRLKKLKSGGSADGSGTGESDIARRKRNFNSTTGEGGQIIVGGVGGAGNGSGGTMVGEGSKHKLSRRVSFDPLALLLDASLEGELELVEKTAMQVTNPSAANDEGITALHNAICAGHFEIVKFLVNFGCDVNAQDSDGWTPLHCAASCNNLPMVKFLVESGACLFAATLSDHETPAEKCEEDEEGFDGCSEYLYSIQEKLGILNNGEVFAVFSYESQQPDELSFYVNDKLTIIRKGDEAEREWWWARNASGKEGYVPRNLFGLHPRQAPSYIDDN
uniref:SH3 domain-containing protein n=1 Tax=Anopheles farauti TaxID=69004 RepID=A0A182QWF0_9DIPT